MSISPLEGPLSVQSASPDGAGGGGKRNMRRVVRRVGQAVLETSESGDEIVVSDAARALADALEAKLSEEGGNAD